MSESVKISGTSYPVFADRPHYIDGYDPSSLYAPHSSLRRFATWAGMGLILTSLIGMGTLVYGLAIPSEYSAESGRWVFFAVFGGILTLACLVGGFGAIHYGRSKYRQYRAETGRVN
ncbi:hypothetical protein EML15_09370 [Corynebacterium sp. sy017]|uniref:hypothetical protein n=1 Tax=unclassified Corynebacterium TaxID=2624378 RepID=UPI0011860D21|nr:MULTISPECIES: hypothetical protein [unclassified Corynebacterium]MBP3089348.1 hypothetical protein [Corynebacterium sp. sy017]QDZ43281.1 hypothetical protein FQV43_09055 [Corynebacterium sp. sy039]TSD90956.1 hypothetical protein ELY17_09230 [Corynebacterium sp. SY003]